MLHRIFSRGKEKSAAVFTQTMPVTEMREAFYQEAAKTLTAIRRPGFITENDACIEVAAKGIVDGWSESPTYDPEIAISTVVSQAIMLHNDALQRYATIWDREIAVMNGVEARRTETKIVIHAGRDMSWCWEHSSDMPRNLRMVYGACTGMGVAYGLSLEPRCRYPRSDWDLRPIVRKGLVAGAYAKIKGIFEKRSGLFDMELTESEWLAKA